MSYNPYNTKNRMLTHKELRKILETYIDVPVNVRDIMLYQTAMVHSSYVKRKDYTTPTGEPTELAPRPDACLELFDSSYERLEHLGDSVLGACVSTYLLNRFPDENEWFLTDLKKEIVCNETLGLMCEKMGLNAFYIISRHNEDVCFGRANLKKLGDILEAFIGALWTDTFNDFSIVYKFVVCLIEQYINIPQLLMNNRNYKEQFQKLFQAKYHTTPTYYIVSSENGVYEMGVNNANGMCIGKGSATTKKQAEQMAAKQAITHFSQ
jgi:ribonuclease-3